MTNKSLEVICQSWTEYEFESGWGASQRPDGVSLHLDESNLQEYLDLNWNVRDLSKTPNYYMKPDDCGICKVKVSEKLFNEILNAGSGLRMYRCVETELRKSFDLVKI
jgi:hypothetical protein